SRDGRVPRAEPEETLVRESTEARSTQFSSFAMPDGERQEQLRSSQSLFWLGAGWTERARSEESAICCRPRREAAGGGLACLTPYPSWPSAKDRPTIRCRFPRA